MNKITKLILSSAAALSLFGFGLSALAAANPSGTGQPSQSCGSPDASIIPNGFSTDGFIHATTVYAGSDGTASALHAQSSHAVSQYDIACYQVTNK